MSRALPGASSATRIMIMLLQAVCCCWARCQLRAAWLDRCYAWAVFSKHWTQLCDGSSYTFCSLTIPVWSPKALAQSIESIAFFVLLPTFASFIFMIHACMHACISAGMAAQAQAILHSCQSQNSFQFFRDVVRTAGTAVSKQLTILSVYDMSRHIYEKMLLQLRAGCKPACALQHARDSGTYREKRVLV